MPVAAMMTEFIEPGAASVEEAKLFHDMARKWTPLSNEIKRVHFRFGEDSDGSPAVWITVVVPTDLKPSKRKIAAIYNATESFKRDVMEAETNRWPYINVETE
jgi:hypothetical protein